MFFHAKNFQIDIGESCLDGIVFGSGKQNLIMIPGLSDGLKTIKGLAVPFAMMYLQYTHNYRVYIFSSRRTIPEGFTTRQMAADIYAAMVKLGIKQTSVLGISQGGMVAQYLAIDHPEAVNKLVLAVSAARPNEILLQAVNGWTEFAKNSDYKNLFIDTTERSYTERRLRQYRPLYPLLCRIGRPKDFGRFLALANACTKHDSYNELDKINCPTLIIGGGCDRIVGTHAASELAERISGSRLHIYPELVHSLYEEAGISMNVLSVFWISD